MTKEGQPEGTPLIERLRTMKNFWLNGAAWMMSTEPAPLGIEAADRIDELEILNNGHQRLATQYRERAEAAEAENQSLREQLEAALLADAHSRGIIDVRDAALRGAELDAARYRWLRRFDHFAIVDSMLNTTEYNTLDTAIDAAIAGEGGKG